MSILIVWKFRYLSGLYGSLDIYLDCIETEISILIVRKLRYLS